MSKDKQPQEAVEKVVKLINKIKMEKPKKEKYGWHNQEGFDDLESGWMLEGGEEAYLEALEKWKMWEDNGLGEEDRVNEKLSNEAQNPPLSKPAVSSRFSSIKIMDAVVKSL